MSKELMKSLEKISGLNSVLEKIEAANSNKKIKSDILPSTTSSSLPNKPLPIVNDIWYEFIEPSSGKSYYHNYVTNETSWEKPTSFIPYTKPIQPNEGLSATSLDKDNNYSFVASFGKNSGRFSGASSYWEANGRPTDRAGRQLAHYVDLEELEKNRAETKAKQAEMMKNMSSADWKELKEKQKEKKKRNREAWLKEE